MRLAQQRGFTLIELLLTVALIGILTTVATTSYQHQISKVRRWQMTATLWQLAAQLDEHYLKNHTYLGMPQELLADDHSYRGSYLVQPDIQTESYTLRAIPIGSQLRDTQCGELILASSGQRNIGGTGSVNNCWR